MRRKSLDYHFHPLISQHDVRAPDLSLPIKTLSSTAIRKIMNSRWQFLIPRSLGLAHRRSGNEISYMLMTLQYCRVPALGL